MSNTIFNTDFEGSEKIIVYIGGKFAYEGAIDNLTDEQKRKYSRCDWYNLAGYEDCDIVFIG